MSTKEPEIFRLTDGEKLSPLWQRLKAHLEEKLARVRAMNDHNMPESFTAMLRGDIRQLKALIALGDEDDRPQTE